MTQPVSGGQRITITRTPKDQYGNPSGDPSSWPIDNALFWQDEVTWDITRRNTSIVVGYVSVPRGSDIAQADEVTLADERTFLAMAAPEWDQNHPLSAAPNGYMAVRVRGVF